MPERPLKILYVASEVSPWAKTGGLADVSSALPRHLSERGHEVLLIVPLYGRVRRSGVPLTPVENAQDLSVKMGPHEVRFSLFTAPLPDSDQLVHFVRCSQLYDRGGIYTQDHDEHLRFLSLSFAALRACQHLGFSPDIAHVHDWQTAIIPLALKCRFAWDGTRFGKTKTVLTIHNLAHQGVFGGHIVNDTGLEDSAHLFHADHLEGGMVNLMLTGILYADAVTTVSPSYAREIQGAELGMGLDSYLRARSSTVVGILNGIDRSEWSPETDRLIPHHYSTEDLTGKERNKVALLQTLGLPYHEGLPVAGVVSRMTAQKGLELILDVLPSFLARGELQLAVLGSGASSLEDAFVSLQHRFPSKVCFYRGFSNELAHQIEAGADIFLMPSRFEPCGLNQMYSQRYGTIPVVRATGGLRDSVIPFNPRTREGTGVVFEHFTEDGLRWGVRTALSIYRDKEALSRVRDNGMRQDFSWSKRVTVYEALYRKVLAK